MAMSKQETQPEQEIQQEQEAVSFSVEGSDPDSDSLRIARELEAQPNWSAKIRYLSLEGFRNSSISHILTELRGYYLSPQHVNNVLKRPLKGSGVGRPAAGHRDPRESTIVSLVKRSELRKTRK